MNTDQIKKVLNTLDDEEETINILYWFCRGLNEDQIAFKVEPQSGTIRNRLKNISSKMSAGYVLNDEIPGEPLDPKYRFITGEVATVVLEGLGRENPDWSMYPFEVSETMQTTIQDGDRRVENDTEVNQTTTQSNANTSFAQRSERLREILSTPQGLVISGLLILALFFGLWRFVFTGTRNINPITNQPIQETSTSEAILQAESSPEPTADSQIAVEQTLTARAPTPDLAQTQAANEAEIATNVAARETAAVTDTPTPTPTFTSTPTPTWTPSPTLTPSPVPPPPTENLVLYLPLDGNANDNSGNGLNALSNSALPSEDRHNEPNAAYFFNENSSIVIPDALELRGNTYPLTIAVWINPVRTNGVNPIIVKYLNAWRKDWGLRIDDGLLTFTSENGTHLNPKADYICRQTSGTIIQNEWQLVAFVAEEPNVYLYVNGKLVASCPDFVDRWTDTEQAVELGMSGYQGIGYVGAIDEVWIWNRALSSEEMLSLYQFTK